MMLSQPDQHGSQAQQVMRPRRACIERLDPFTRAVPDAGFDICMLFQHEDSTPAIDRFQLLLRGLCALNRQVTRAAMIDDRIELQIDGAKLVLGHVDGMQGLPLYRPRTTGPSLHTGRLAYLLSHHDLALRLRIDITASVPLISEIAHLAMRPHPPKAVILLASGILLSHSEFRTHDRDTLDRLVPGPLIATLRPRYQRPAGCEPSARPSPCTPSSRPPVPSTGRPTVFARAPGRTGFQTAGVDPLDQIVTTYCDARSADAVVAAFRTATGRARASGRLRRKAPGSCPAQTDLLCDAVMLEYRGRRVNPLAPIPLVTLVLFAQITQVFSPQALPAATTATPGPMTGYSA